MVCRHYLLEYRGAIEGAIVIDRDSRSWRDRLPAPGKPPPLGEIATPQIEPLRRAIVGEESDADPTDRRSRGDPRLRFVHQTTADPAPVKRWQNVENSFLRYRRLAKRPVG